MYFWDIHDGDAAIKICRKSRSRSDPGNTSAKKEGYHAEIRKNGDRQGF